MGTNVTINRVPGEAGARRWQIGQIFLENESFNADQVIEQVKVPAQLSDVEVVHLKRRPMLHKTSGDEI